MKELIKIEEQSGKKAVNARDLHSFLGSKKDFSDWIKQRLSKYGLIEKVDYVVFPRIGENQSGGRPMLEYALTIEAAKELAMVEGNAKGKEARQYFIECEKALKQPQQQSPEQLVLQAIKYLESKVELQEQKLIEQAPKVEYYEKVLESNATWTTTTIAKELGISAIDLNRRLKELDVQYKVDDHWVLKARFQNKGYTDTRTHYILNDGKPTTKVQTVWTESGRKFIHDLLDRKTKDTSQFNYQNAM